MTASWIFMGFLCFTSITSITFALFARDRIRRSGGKLRGYQLTHWAVVLGLLEVFLVVFIVLFVPFRSESPQPQSTWIRSRDEHQHPESTAPKLQKGLHTRSSSHEGRWMTLDFHCPTPSSIPEPESVASTIRESLVEAERDFSIDRLERRGDRLRGRVVFPWRRGDGYLLQEKLLQTIAQELGVDRNDIDLEFQETLLRPARILDR